MRSWILQTFYQFYIVFHQTNVWLCPFACLWTLINQPQAQKCLIASSLLWIKESNNPNFNIKLLCINPWIIISPFLSWNHKNIYFCLGIQRWVQFLLQCDVDWATAADSPNLPDWHQLHILLSTVHDPRKSWACQSTLASQHLHL